MENAEAVRRFWLIFVICRLGSGERMYTYLHVSPMFGLVDEGLERGHVSTDGVEQCHVGRRLGAQTRQAHFQRLERLMLHSIGGHESVPQIGRQFELLGGVIHSLGGTYSYPHLLMNVFMLYHLRESVEELGGPWAEEGPREVGHERGGEVHHADADDACPCEEGLELAEA